MLKSYRAVYREYHDKIVNYFLDGEPKLWEFSSDLAFERYDLFMDHVETVKVT